MHMKNPNLNRKMLLTAMAATLSFAAIMPAMAADQPVHIRGTILDVTSSGFTVQTDTGPKTIAVAAETKVAGVVPSSLFHRHSQYPGSDILARARGGGVSGSHEGYRPG
jgi:ABC-type sugar transport system substrate-binding protein